jgi:hypothetical protein
MSTDFYSLKMDSSNYIYYSNHDKTAIKVKKINGGIKKNLGSPLKMFTLRPCMVVTLSRSTRI